MVLPFLSSSLSKAAVDRRLRGRQDLISSVTVEGACW
jgi:hypothetical protein